MAGKTWTGQWQCCTAGALLKAQTGRTWSCLAWTWPTTPSPPTLLSGVTTTFLHCSRLTAQHSALQRETCIKCLPCYPTHADTDLHAEVYTRQAPLRLMSYILYLMSCPQLGLHSTCDHMLSVLCPALPHIHKPKANMSIQTHPQV